MDELRILNITPGGEVRFHFLGGRRDTTRVREALSRLVERGRLGNASLVPTQLAFRQEPTLLLQSVRVNHARSVVQEGDEFILSCVAQGSARTTFRWYKDGALVNQSRALRRVWTRLLPADAQDQYTALLGVAQASALDEGRYTCQVTDWGMQQCRSLRLQVKTRPEVRLLPTSVTLERGEDVNIKCMSPNDQRLEKFGFNWTKNKALFRMRPGSEVWEDLYPSGSILKIYNAQKSALYTCKVHGSLASPAASVHVEVVNSSLVPTCPAEASHGVAWPRSAPHLDAVVECPAQRKGLARRQCVSRDKHLATWSPPDFSGCVAQPLANIRDKFRSLTLGFEMTTGSTTLHALQTYIYRVVTFGQLLPGEGEIVISLLGEVQNYLNLTASGEEVLNSTHMFFHITSLILSSPHSLVNQERVIQMQELVKAEAILWGKQLPMPNAAHANFSHIAVYVATLESPVKHKLHFPTRSISAPAWISERIDICTEGTSKQVYGNGSFTISVIVYKNLSQFLPLRYAATLEDDTEVQYELNSRVVTIELGINGQRIDPPPDAFRVDLELDHLLHDYNAEEWNVSCGVTKSATFEHSWEIEGCIAHTMSTNSTKCRCTQTGTYAILLTKRPVESPAVPPSSYPMIVVAGCICCLVQALVTLVLLIPYWWHHRNCLIFLKLQCCTATTGAMGIFIYAVRDAIPKSSYPYVTTSLEAFLLIGMSSHLSKLLIVYTEVVQIPKVRHIKQTVVCIITGVPVLAILCNHLAHHSTSWKLNSWWLFYGTMIFNIFVATAVIMLLLFVFLYFSVMRKLHVLSGKNTESNKAIKRRVGLLQRAGLIFGVMVVMGASSILYINVPHYKTCHYIFSFTSAFLGFIIFLCYILKSEAPLHRQVLRKLKLSNPPEDDFSSESANSPLRFFTKQDGDAESEGPPPRPSSALSRRGSRGTAEGQQGGLASGDEEGDGDPSEGLLLVETGRNYRWTPPSDGAPSTVETYVHSANGSAEDCGMSLKMRRTVQRNGNSNVRTEDVDLENYHNSPRKYQQAAGVSNPQSYGEYVEKEEVQNTAASSEPWRFVRGYRTLPISVPRPEPAQCFIRDTTTPPPPLPQQEIMTTRVCVELGVITSQPDQGSGEDGSASSGAPAIVLCNVDVEPCTRSLLELTEVTATVETCHNRMPHTAVASIALTDDITTPPPPEPSIIESNKSASPEPANVLDSEQAKEPIGDCIKVATTVANTPTIVIASPSPVNICEDSKDSPKSPIVTAEKSNSMPKSNSENPKDEDNMEGMLDRISHDLDYLLNRKPQTSNGTVIATPSFSRRASKPPSSTIPSQIKEEEEGDDDETHHQ